MLLRFWKKGEGFARYACILIKRTEPSSALLHYYSFENDWVLILKSLITVKNSVFVRGIEQKKVNVRAYISSPFFWCLRKVNIDF